MVWISQMRLELLLVEKQARESYHEGYFTSMSFGVPWNQRDSTLLSMFLGREWRSKSILAKEQ